MDTADLAATIRTTLTTAHRTPSSADGAINHLVQRLRLLTRLRGIGASAHDLTVLRPLTAAAVLELDAAITTVGALTVNRPAQPGRSLGEHPGRPLDADLSRAGKRPWSIRQIRGDDDLRGLLGDHLGWINTMLAIEHEIGGAGIYVASQGRVPQLLLTVEHGVLEIAATLADRIDRLDVAPILRWADRSGVRTESFRSDLHDTIVDALTRQADARLARSGRTLSDAQFDRQEERRHQAASERISRAEDERAGWTVQSVTADPMRSLCGAPLHAPVDGPHDAELRMVVEAILNRVDTALTAAKRRRPGRRQPGTRVCLW